MADQDVQKFRNQVRNGTRTWFWLGWDGRRNVDVNGHLEPAEGNCNKELKFDTGIDDLFRERKAYRERLSKFQKGNIFYYITFFGPKEVQRSSQKLRAKFKISARTKDDDNQNNQGPIWGTHVLIKPTPPQPVACFKLGIKRFHLVKHLLIHIYELINGNRRNLVYQEVLGSSDIDKLPLAEPDTNYFLDQIKCIDIDDNKTYLSGDFEVQIWVANRENSFKVDSVNQPYESFTRTVYCVHTRSVNPRGNKQIDDLAAFPRFSISVPRRVTMLLPKLDTNMKFEAPYYHPNPQTEIDDDWQAKARKIPQYIDRANWVLGPSQDDEVRILLLPEWYFTRTAHGKLATKESWFHKEAEKNAIYQVLQDIYIQEDTYRKWIIIPGTILWGTPAVTPPEVFCREDNIGFSFILNTMPLLYWQNNQVHMIEYSKRIHGNDTPFDMIPEKFPFDDWNLINVNANPPTLPNSLINKLYDLKAVSNGERINHTLDLQSLVRPAQDIWTIETNRDGKTFSSMLYMFRDQNDMCIVSRDTFAMNLIHENVPNNIKKYYFRFIDYDIYYNYLRDSDQRHWADNIHGLRFGFEICAEHEKALGMQAGGFQDQAGVDIHVIPGCNTTVHKELNMAEHNRIVVCSDGNDRGRKMAWIMVRPDYDVEHYQNELLGEQNNPNPVRVFRLGPAKDEIRRTECSSRDLGDDNLACFQCNLI